MRTRAHTLVLAVAVVGALLVAFGCGPGTRAPARPHPAAPAGS